MLTAKEIRIYTVLLLAVLGASHFHQQLFLMDPEIKRKETSQNASVSHAHAVFFNVYFSGKNETLELTRNATYEQMEQIASSYAAQHSLLS